MFTLTHRLGSSLAPGTSAVGSAGSGYGLCGQSGSSSAESMSTWHCFVDCGEKTPARETGKSFTSNLAAAMRKLDLVVAQKY